MIYLLLLMIHTWVRRPPSGPIMYILFITMGAEGEGWDAVKLAYLSPPVIHYWSFECGTFSVAVFVKWFVVFHLQMFFSLCQKMTTRMQAVFEDRYMKVKLDIWKLSLDKSVAAFFGKGLPDMLVIFLWLFKQSQKKKRKNNLFFLPLILRWIWLYQSLSSLFFFFFFFFFYFNKQNEWFINCSGGFRHNHKGKCFVCAGFKHNRPQATTLYNKQRGNKRKRGCEIMRNTQCQIHCTWYSSSMKMCLSCQPNEDWRPLNG